jgi:hypothetical protein
LGEEDMGDGGKLHEMKRQAIYAGIGTVGGDS